MAASLMRGKKNLTAEAKGVIPTSKQKENKEVSKDNESEGQPDSAVTLDYIVVNAYNGALTQRITIDTAASIIVGRIRVKFIEGIKKCHENGTVDMDIESLKYIDEVLFEDLEYIIKSVFHFGTKNACIKLSQCMKMIRDAAALVQYQIDRNSYNEIESILKVVYNE